MLSSFAITRRQQFLIRVLGGYCSNQTHHQFRMHSLFSGSGLETDTCGILRAITPSLDPTRYKGQAEVRYVPDFKKNLISRGALNSKGYLITVEGGAAKVVYSAMVVMKGTWHNNMYFLQGSTALGEGAMASNVGEDTLDTNRLCHMCLAHGVDKAMQDNICKIAVIGGCREYTGAPYFSAISALKIGADLSHVFCTKDAAPVIKGYSPELIVHPVLEESYSVRDEDKKSISERVLAEVEKWMERFDCLVVGPGLGRDPFLLDCVGNIMKLARRSNVPIVIDGDGLFLVTNSLDLVSGYPLAILTPNINEYKRLVQNVLNCEVNDQDAPGQLLYLAKRIGGVTVLRKGKSDLISDGKTVRSVSTYGSPRRCGGQGDILSGSVAVFVSWARQYISSAKEEPTMNPAVLGCIAGSTLVRKAASRAFEEKRRSTLTGDIIEYLGSSMEEICPVS